MGFIRVSTRKNSWHLGKYFSLLRWPWKRLPPCVHRLQSKRLFRICQWCTLKINLCRVRALDWKHLRCKVNKRKEIANVQRYCKEMANSWWQCSWPRLNWETASFCPSSSTWRTWDVQGKAQRPYEVAIHKWKRNSMAWWATCNRVCWLRSRISKAWPRKKKDFLYWSLWSAKTTQRVNLLILLIFKLHIC